MAQTTEREQTKSSEAGDAKTTGTPRPGLAQRLLRPLASLPSAARNAGTASGQQGTAKRNSMGGTFKFFLGMIIFLVAAQFFGTILSGLNQNNHWGLERPLAPKGTFLLAGLSPLLIVYFGIAVAIWALLYYFKIIPKDPFGTKAAAQARADRAAAATSTQAGGRSRAQRRQSTTTTVKGGSTTARVVVNREHDDAYERVRAAQRAKRRRGAKR